MADPAETKQWYAMDVDEALAQVESSRDGLTHDQAQRRIADGGPNALTGEEGVTVWRLLVRQIHNPFPYFSILKMRKIS